MRQVSILKFLAIASLSTQLIGFCRSMSASSPTILPLALDSFARRQFNNPSYTGMQSTIFNLLKLIR